MSAALRAAEAAAGREQAAGLYGVGGGGGPGSSRGTVEMGSTCVQSLGRSERGREGR